MSRATGSQAPWAPRFMALFKRVEGRRILVMRRGEWRVIRGSGEAAVEIELSLTPIAEVEARAELAAAVATRLADDTVEIAVYRRDERDAKPINVDRYLVWESVPKHLDFVQMVNTASTFIDDNMRAFLDEWVFFVKEQPGPDHWLDEVPAEIRAVVTVQHR